MRVRPEGADDPVRRGPVHASFASRFGERRRLDYGLDFIKAMPAEWSDAQRWAEMVRLYDDLLRHSEELQTEADRTSSPAT